MRSAVGVFRHYMDLTWAGGDTSSSEQFNTSRSALHQDLIARGILFDDDHYDLHVLAAVPQASIPMNGTIDLRDPKLTSFEAY